MVLQLDDDKDANPDAWHPQPCTVLRQELLYEESLYLTRLCVCPLKQNLSRQLLLLTIRSFTYPCLLAAGTPKRSGELTALSLNHVTDAWTLSKQPGCREHLDELGDQVKLLGLESRVRFVASFTDTCVCDDSCVKGTFLPALVTSHVRRSLVWSVVCGLWSLVCGFVP